MVGGGNALPGLAKAASLFPKQQLATEKSHFEQHYEDID
jgi:hypothetical protein